MPNEPRNDIRYVIAEVEEVNSKCAKARVELLSGKKYLVQFPYSVVEALNLELGQKFYWYPQPSG